MIFVHTWLRHLKDCRLCCCVQTHLRAEQLLPAQLAQLAQLEGKLRPEVGNPAAKGTAGEAGPEEEEAALEAEAVGIELVLAPCSFEVGSPLGVAVLWQDFGIGESSR